MLPESLHERVHDVKFCGICELLNLIQMPNYLTLQASITEKYILRMHNTNHIFGLENTVSSNL